MANFITEAVDAHEEELHEAFERLTSFIKTNQFTNKQVAQSNRILSNLTKQIWSRFYLYRKQQTTIAKNKGFVVLPMDKKFVLEFIKNLKAEPEVEKRILAQISNDVKTLDALYKGTRSKKVSKEDIKSRAKQKRIVPMTIMTRIINAIALETTLQYLDIKMDMDLDYDSIDPNNRKSLMSKMNQSTKGIASELASGIGQAISDRSKRK